MLTDAQVLAVVACAYDVEAELGLYVQCHAEVSARMKIEFARSPMSR